MQSVADRILQTLDSLTSAERRVGRSILSSYPSSGLRSASAIATEAGASPATVLRFVVKVGFTGLPEFHEALRTEIGHRLTTPFLEVEVTGENEFLDTVRDAEQTIVRETLGRLDGEVLEAVRRTLMGRNRLWIFGGRFSQSLAHYLYAHMQLFRADVRLLSPWPAPIPDQLFHVSRGDCLFAIDFRRYQPEAEFAARYIKSRRGKVIVMTDPFLSPATHHADHTLIASFEGAMLLDSHTGATSLIDTIVSYIMSKDEALLRQRIASVEKARALLAQQLSQEYAAEGDGSDADSLRAPEGGAD